MSARSRLTRLVCVGLTLVIAASAFAGCVRTAKGLVGRATVGSSPIQFWGQDTNGDTLYDYLWVNITLQVTVQDVFTFDLQLKDQPTNMTTIATSQNITYLLMGVHKVPMLVKGYAISLFQPATNGPYHAVVRVNNELSQPVVWTAADSPAYFSTDFAGSPAILGPSSGDQGVDLDVPPDTLFNQLIATFPISFTESGVYVLVAQLFDPGSGNMIGISMLAIQGVVGSYSYNVTFSGLAISGTGLNGPYGLAAAVIAILGGTFVMLSQTIGLTGIYQASQFQTRALAAISGTVVDPSGTPVQGATVTFTNYTDIFQVTNTTDAAGFYTLNVYAGDFGVILNAAGFDDVTTWLTVTGPGTYDFATRPPSQDFVNISAVMVSPDAVLETVNMTSLRQVPSMRMQLDWGFGNKDAYVTKGEQDILLSLAVAGMAFPVDDTDDEMYLDDIFYYPDDYENNKLDVDFSGPVVSYNPALVGRYDHRASNRTIPYQATHIMRVNVTYDNQYEATNLSVTLPPGWIATSYEPMSANVTVAGIGTGNLIIDPLWNPSPAVIPDYVWINITISDTTYVPFTIEGQDAVPDPAEYQQPVIISAWVNSTNPITQVTVEVRSPLGAILGNFTMNLNLISGKYEYMLTSYPDLGLYSYTIWATDSGGNVRSAGGTFVVRDTTLPVADAGPDQLVVIHALVNFDGTASTDNFGIENWTWTFNDGVGPVTLYGSTPSHTFDVTGSFLVTLTVRDFATLEDADTMYVNVTDSSKIPPTVEGPSAVPDPAEYPANVLISAWVNDSSPIDQVAVNVTAPVTGWLGNFTMSLGMISGKYEYSLTNHPDLGTYSYVIWANDTDNNSASAGGNFVVQDTTDPTAEAGPDQNVASATLVTLDGSGSTDNYKVDNWTWTFNNGTADITLYGDIVTHRFYVTGPHLVTLTVRDTTGHTDTDTMTVFVMYPPTPNPPTNVQATQTAADSVTVTWSKPTTNTNGSAIVGPLTYNVYRSTDPSSGYTQVNPSPVSLEQYPDSPVQPGTYYYKVEAINQWGNKSALSSPPAQVTVTDKGRVVGGVESGGLPLAGATVEILNSTGAVVNSTTTGSDGAFSFSNLSPGTYTVRASKSGYESNQKSATVIAFQTRDVGIITLTPLPSEGIKDLWIWIVIAVVIIVVVVLLVVLMLRRRAKPVEQPETPPPPPPPQEAAPPPAPQAPPQQPPQQKPPPP